MRIFFSFILLLSLSSTALAQSIKYELKMPKPQNHYYHVEMVLEGFSDKTVDVKMPIWAPGSYLAREFAKNVNLVKAYDASGNELAVKKTNKNTWKINKGKAKKITVKYEVYAFEISVRTSFLDLTHGFVSGSGVFMYIDGYKNKSGKVDIYPYEDFNVITTALKEAPEGVSKDGFTTYVFDDYDQLVDCPIEIGNQEVFDFMAAGVKHTVAMYDFGNYDIESLKKDMAKVVEATTDVFGQNPNKEYTFIVHNGTSGGLEHTNSTVLGANRWGYEGEKYIDFLELVAHEYFHLWNVKRIRPIELGPFNYDEENYTSLLWVMEGFTSYYEKLVLLKAGYFDSKTFLNKMFSSLNYVEGSMGARVQPVSHASFDAWIKAYRPNENSQNTTASYYSRGSVIAMMLDAKIIANHKGEKTLDDFMRLIYDKYYVGKGRGFSESEFKQELTSFLGESMDEFYEKYIDGTEIPDYPSIFAPVGLKVEYVGKPKPSVGMSLSQEGGKTIIKRIRSNSPAEESGLSVNDEIIGVNWIRTDKKTLEKFFESVVEGSVFSVLLARGDQIFSTEIHVTNFEQPKFAYSFSEEDNGYFNQWMRYDKR